VYDPGAFKIFAGGNSIEVVSADLTGLASFMPKAQSPKSKTDLKQGTKD
jgi:hypothetical protein